MRACDSCGRKLPGKKFHGFVKADGKALVCGRSAATKMVLGADGPEFVTVETPRCRSG